MIEQVEFISPKQAADYLGLKTQTIYNWICLGRLKAYRLKGSKVKSRVRLKKKDIEDMLGG